MSNKNMDSEKAQIIKEILEKQAILDLDSIGYKKNTKLASLHKKLMQQRMILNAKAEKSYLQDGTLSHEHVAEEAEKFYGLAADYVESDDDCSK